MSITNANFEAPTLGAGNFAYAPALATWTFTGGAGISANGSGFTGTGPQNAPEGSQVAFIQGTGTISQSASFTPGSHCLAFSAARRALGGPTDLRVSVGSNVIGLFRITGTSYSTFTTAQFTTAGSDTVTFQALNTGGGDNTVFFDNILVIDPLGVDCPIPGGGFESPFLTGGTYTVAPAGTPWTWSGQAGISANGSPYTGSSATIPPVIGADAIEGLQVAFCQSAGSKFRQTLVVESGFYNFTFWGRQRAASNPTAGDFNFNFAGVTLAHIAPPNTSFTLYEINGVEVLAGSRTIEWAGLDSGGSAASFLIDDARYQLVSRPSGSPALGARLGSAEVRSGGAVVVSGHWAFEVNAGAPVLFTLTPSIGTVDNTTRTLAATSGATWSTMLRIPDGTPTSDGTLTITNDGGLPTVVLDYHVALSAVKVVEVVAPPSGNLLIVEVRLQDGVATIPVSSVAPGEPGDQGVLTVDGTPINLTGWITDGVVSSAICPLQPDQYNVFVDDADAVPFGTWLTDSTFPLTGGGDQAVGGGVFRYCDNTSTPTLTYTFLNVPPGEFELCGTIIDAPGRTTDAAYEVKDGATTLDTLHLNQVTTGIMSRDQRHGFRDVNNVYRYTWIGSRTDTTIIVPAGVPRTITVKVWNAAGTGRIMADRIGLVQVLPPIVTAASVATLTLPDGFLRTSADTTGPVTDFPVTFKDQAAFYPFNPATPRNMRIGYNMTVPGAYTPVHIAANLVVIGEGWQPRVGVGRDPVTLELLGVDASVQATLPIASSYGVNYLDGFGFITVNTPGWFCPDPLDTDPDDTTGLWRVEFYVPLTDTHTGYVGLSDGYGHPYEIWSGGPGVGTESYAIAIAPGVNTFLCRGRYPASATHPTATPTIFLYFNSTHNGSQILQPKVYGPGTPLDWTNFTHPALMDRMNRENMGPIRWMQAQGIVNNIIEVDDILPPEVICWGIVQFPGAALVSLDPADIAGNTDGCIRSFGNQTATTPRTLNQGPIKVTTATPHGFSDCEFVQLNIDGVLPIYPHTQTGMNPSNGFVLTSQWHGLVHVIDDTHFIFNATEGGAHYNVPVTLTTSYAVTGTVTRTIYSHPPLAHMAQVHNETGRDIWFCLSRIASDACVAAIVEYFAVNCPTAKLYLEFWNEWWNTTGQATSWEQRARELAWDHGWLHSEPMAYAYDGNRRFAVAGPAWTGAGRDRADLMTILGTQLGGPSHTSAYLAMPATFGGQTVHFDAVTGANYVDPAGSYPGTSQADIDNPHRATVAGGAVTAITTGVRGQSYSTVPFVVISGDGTGATATASLVGGRLGPFTITSGGSGYTYALVYVPGSTSQAFDRIFARENVEVMMWQLPVITNLFRSHTNQFVGAYAGLKFPQYEGGVQASATYGINGNRMLKMGMGSTVHPDVYHYEKVHMAKWEELGCPVAAIYCYGIIPASFISWFQFAGDDSPIGDGTMPGYPNLADLRNVPSQLGGAHRYYNTSATPTPTPTASSRGSAFHWGF